MARARAAREFLDDGAEHESADAERQERADIAHPRDEENQQHEDA